MSDFFKLKHIDSQLQSIINPITFFDINPSNAEKEKEKVMKDSDYEPFFIYPSLRFCFDDVQSQLHNLETCESTLGNILESKRKLFIDKCEMLNNRGSKKFSVFGKKVYGMPTIKTLEHSAGLLTIESEKEKKPLTSIKVAHNIQAEINHYGFNYSVQTRPMAASAMVLVSKKKIYVKSGSNFSQNYLQRLLIHEIGTHVLRAENGREQPFNIFYHGFPGYLETEEGLAVANEERFGLLTNENLKNYAARAIAVKMAMTNSFSKIYNYLLDYFPSETAFRITLRAKRGMSDTSKPGGCTKDHVYMSGFLKLKEYLKNGGDISCLYYGKIGLNHIDLLEDIHGITKPKFLPKNQSFKSLLSF